MLNGTINIFNSNKMVLTTIIDQPFTLNQIILAPLITKKHPQAIEIGKSALSCSLFICCLGLAAYNMMLVNQ